MFFDLESPNKNLEGKEFDNHRQSEKIDFYPSLGENFGSPRSIKKSALRIDEENMKFQQDIKDIRKKKHSSNWSMLSLARKFRRDKRRTFKELFG